MHWFWRVLIAVVFVSVLWSAYSILVFPWHLNPGSGWSISFRHQLYRGLPLRMGMCSLAIAAYALLTRRFDASGNATRERSLAATSIAARIPPFFRALVAVGLGTAIGMLVYHWITNLAALVPMSRGPLVSPWLQIKVMLYVAGYGCCAVAALLIWNLLNGRGQIDNETRCRKCQYILKGMSEPICPECGERI